MDTMMYHRSMTRMLAIIIIAVALLLSLLLAPLRAGARIVILQNLQPTAPIVALKEIDKVLPATSNLETGTVYVPPMRSLTTGEKNDRIRNIEAQIAKLQALIAKMYGRN